MPLKKWIIQHLVALPLVFLLLAGVQYFKGRGLEYAVSFGLYWSFISLGIFSLTRVYYFRKGINCKVCNDLPEKNTSSSSKSPH